MRDCSLIFPRFNKLLFPRRVYCVGTLQASGFGDESLVDWFTCFSGILNVHFTA